MEPEEQLVIPPELEASLQANPSTREALKLIRPEPSARQPLDSLNQRLSGFNRRLVGMIPRYCMNGGIVSVLFGVFFFYLASRERLNPTQIGPIDETFRFVGTWLLGFGAVFIGLGWAFRRYQPGIEAPLPPEERWPQQWVTGTIKFASAAAAYFVAFVLLSDTSLDDTAILSLVGPLGYYLATPLLSRWGRWLQRRKEQP